ncbi:NAD(P)-dependent oxidoreductase [Candidatus Poriferisodalis sp.]|uniref:NAD(P)-dependent oxidoreductase n=1 Tax=Candidatus Poriferisodalis sp. TaxID=3101277 RepID=UPI003B5BB11A
MTASPVPAVTPMHILFADKIDTGRLGRLEASGHHCIVKPELTAEELADHIEGVEVLVVRSTEVKRKVFKAADRLAMVLRAGAGTDTIDCDGASKFGVYVCNVPGRNAVAVAELTMGLLLAIDRQIPDATSDLHEGRWNKAQYMGASGLKGRRMAVVGMGAIGIEVARRAVAFGIDVSALYRSDRSNALLAEMKRHEIEVVPDWDSLLAGADIVSLHLPANPETCGLVDAEFLAKMPDGAILLNTSRGEIVDEGALLRALDERGMRAGLDVFQGEPSGAEPNWRSPLASHPSVTGTHHIGASTMQASEDIADGVVEVLEAFSTGEVLNCVNRAERPLGRSTIVVRHRDQVGVLAGILMALRASGINVLQMRNEILAGPKHHAAVATIRVSRQPPRKVLDELREMEAIYGLRLIKSC